MPRPLYFAEGPILGLRLCVPAVGASSRLVMAIVTDLFGVSSHCVFGSQSGKKVVYKLLNVTRKVKSGRKTRPVAKGGGGSRGVPRTPPFGLQKILYASLAYKIFFLASLISFI